MRARYQLKIQRHGTFYAKSTVVKGLQADHFVKALGEFTGNSDLAAFGELNDADREELSWFLFNPYESILRTEFRLPCQ